MSRRLLRSAVRFGFFPLIFFGVNGLGIALALSDAAPARIALGILVLMAAALGLSFAAERIAPWAPEWNRGQGDRLRDVAHFVVNESISLLPLLAIPLFVAAAPQPAVPPWPHAWPIAAQVLAALLVFDLAQTLFHRLSHLWRPLWRLHAVHHEVRRMYGLNGILKHPLYQVLASIVSSAPLVALGMPKAFALVLAFTTFTQLLLQHSNVDQRLGPWRRVFATAVVHRFHHLRGPAGDVNFALFFSFFDHLLGNAFYEERTLTTDEIGLEDRSYPADWWAQMMAPFQPYETDARPGLLRATETD